jgi:lysophospholipase L1-like esterase
MNSVKIVCIGDSITFGYDIEASRKWTTLLGEELKVDVVNCGINGDTTAGMLSRFEQIILKYNPTHIIITGGTNDLWFGLKDEYIISNVFTMARQAKFLNITPIVGVPTPSYNLNENNFVQEDYAECIRSFQNTLLHFCKEKDIVTIDFSIKMKINHFFEDGIHPNNSGQHIMKNNAAMTLHKII